MTATRGRWWRPTIRVRLTLLYGGMFFLAGAVLLTVMYLLVAGTLPNAAAKQMGSRVLAVTEQTGISKKDLEARLTEYQDQIRENTLDSLLTQSVVALLVAGVVAVLLGWLMAGRVLRPLHQITETARRTADRHLHERIALSGPNDELKELADTFDEMLERLDRSFDGQRRFVANASHELRTPLAINRTLIEVALGRPDTRPETRQLGETLLAVNARHERLIDGLLTLANSDREITEPQPVDLADIARHVAEQATPAATEQRVTLRTTFTAAPTAGDALLLERLVSNLVENAVRYNEPDGWVTVATQTADGHAELVVTNTGPKVAAYELPRLFEPFRRLAPDRTGSARGSGLGLSIVRSVVRAHGGHIHAEPRSTGGLTVLVTLPAGTPHPSP